MTIGNIENDSRLILLDTYDSSYRFEPKEIYRAMMDGIRNLRSIRPESRYHNGFLVEVPFVTSSGADSAYTDIPDVIGTEVREALRVLVINMDDRWREAIVFYVVSRMYLKDDPDTTNLNLSKEYYQKYLTSAQS